MMGLPETNNLQTHDSLSTVLHNKYGDIARISPNFTYFYGHYLVVNTDKQYF
jgi:hypothetical protein